ncbi:MAG: response regulator [Candidatus Kapaibacterium sp.]|nr:MAG: response regulator [Candidatus Kapabacteria bacterium]
MPTNEITILCVDDEQMILESLQMQLENYFGNRFNFEFSEDPADALTLVDEIVANDSKILVIVSDWLMPEMRGDELLTKIHAKYPHIVKVMLTGQADESAVENAKVNANLHRCLSKPWNEKDLIEAIESGLTKV